MNDARNNVKGVNGRGRRGSAYVFVLGISLIVTVLGMATLTLSRVSQKAVEGGNDWEVAGTLAFSAAEQAMSRLNAQAAAAPATWRSGYVSGQTAFTQTAGRNTFGWTLKDETDGNLSADYLRSFRLYGVGTVGQVTRVYSVKVTPGGAALDVLRTALHAGGAVTLTANANAVNGPISSNTSVKLGGTVNASIEAPVVTGNANGTQAVTAPAPIKTMPSPTVFADLAAKATAISFSALGGSSIKNCLLSAASNPYGQANTDGLYSIAIGGGTLNISSCRIVGTLLISATSGAKVTITGPVAWEPGPTRAPILVISGVDTDVTISGSPTWLSESAAGVNLNPPTTPFDGASDNDMSDDFPPYYCGIIHVMAGAGGSVKLNNNAYVRGTVITDCPTQNGAQCTFEQDPSVYADPPFGYASGDVLSEVPGTWRWDAPP